MPAHPKVKVKKIMSSGSDEDADLLNDMFAQMTGTENADPDIIIPKICKLYTLVTKYAKIYKLLLDFTEFTERFPENKDDFAEIKQFVDSLGNIGGDGVNLSEEILKNKSIDDVNILYKKLKTTQEIQTIVIISGNLGKYSRHLSDRNKLGDEFIKREPGLSLKPLTFTNLDLKILWASDNLTPMTKKYILNVLSHTYDIGREVYQIITSPDVDIKKFSNILISNIDKMKKQIPRCDKAFDIIANSVSMLENNFGGYYKTSIEAENPSIIIESFIIDVSLSQKANATVTAQFRKIIMFMKKQSANNKDPRVSKLFKILNNQFSMMQKETGVDPESDDESKENPSKNLPQETTKEHSDLPEHESSDDAPELIEMPETQPEHVD